MRRYFRGEWQAFVDRVLDALDQRWRPLLLLSYTPLVVGSSYLWSTHPRWLVGGVAVVACLSGVVAGYKSRSGYTVAYVSSKLLWVSSAWAVFFFLLYAGIVAVAVGSVSSVFFRKVALGTLLVAVPIVLGPWGFTVLRRTIRKVHGPAGRVVRTHSLRDALAARALLRAVTSGQSSRVRDRLSRLQAHPALSPQKQLASTELHFTFEGIDLGVVCILQAVQLRHHDVLRELLGHYRSMLNYTSSAPQGYRSLAEALDASEDPVVKDLFNSMVRRNVSAVPQ